MKKTLVFLGAISCLGLSLQACTTISKEECREGQWQAIGEQDGAFGYAPTRLERHAKTCANFGITPDAFVYQSGWDKGVRRYCTPTNGFTTGRQSASYHGLCPADMAGAFVAGREIGSALGSAESRLSSLQNTVDSADRREREIEDKIDDLRANRDMNPTERRNRISDLRDQRRRVRNERDDASWQISGAQIELERARHTAQEFLLSHGGKL
jgi:hypothetical protein